MVHKKRAGARGRVAGEVRDCAAQDPAKAIDAQRRDHGQEAREEGRRREDEHRLQAQTLERIEVVSWEILHLAHVGGPAAKRALAEALPAAALWGARALAKAQVGAQPAGQGAGCVPACVGEC